MREEVADFISERDGFTSDPDKIYLTNGASEGIEIFIRLLLNHENDGIMIPIP